ncbi:hypothetical protein CXF46_10450 [Corynebacterium bovis]|nr:hypothetical protein CXF38_10005 [Corynebacterium bovis]RRO83354.1 hypothetical protein CXF36_03320 [Corynebacterium bovis]RRO84514.1 hypothetical protein CXF37_03075 [Corynebacterium bovis]RRO91672.1 hypothetical protein CXF45_03180 [Corynebacterium bovis]RRO95045.1 hypothetical protein CXF29_05830 [Corynebacterium bovis]
MWVSPAVRPLSRITAAEVSTSLSSVASAFGVRVASGNFDGFFPRPLSTKPARLSTRTSTAQSFAALWSGSSAPVPSTMVFFTLIGVGHWN